MNRARCVCVSAVRRPNVFDPTVSQSVHISMIQLFTYVLKSVRILSHYYQNVGSLFFFVSCHLVCVHNFETKRDSASARALAPQLTLAMESIRFSLSGRASRRSFDIRVLLISFLVFVLFRAIHIDDDDGDVSMLSVIEWMSVCV